MLSLRSRSAALVLSSFPPFLVVVALSAVVEALEALAAVSFPVAAVVPLVAVVLLRSPERGSLRDCLASSLVHLPFRLSSL